MDARITLGRMLREAEEQFGELRGRYLVVDDEAALVGLAYSYGVTAAAEPHPSFYALVTLILLALIAFPSSCRSHDPDNPAGDIRRWMRS